MSSTITYKGNTLTTVNNQTRVLNTSGKWLEDDITIVDVTQSGGGTPAISVVDTLDAKGGTVRTITALDISDTTATASDVAIGKYFYTSDGIKTAGSNSGGGGTPSATAHTIYFEFSDNTNATITAYYDDSFISSAITATTPTMYGEKTVTFAQLDSVTWYELVTIPIGVELIDFSKVKEDYVIRSDGSESAEQWYACSDYTPIASGMTFTYRGCRWFYAAYYDSSKTFISSFYIDNNKTSVSQDNSNVGIGELSTGIPANAAYIRISSAGSPDNNNNKLSLIRTA